MASKVNSLEKRVTQLEADLQRLRQKLGEERRLPWYRQILGQFKDDPDFDRIVRLGRKFREADGEKAS